jgi:hypothetical protein
MDKPSYDFLDALLESTTSFEREAWNGAADQIAALGEEHEELARTVRRLVLLDRLQSKQIAQLRELVRALLAMLVEAGTIDRAAFEARVAVALGEAAPPPLHDASAAHPYRGGAPAPRPGFVPCARCGKEIPRRQVFENADGKFCATCFEP